MPKEWRLLEREKVGNLRWYEVFGAMSAYQYRYKGEWKRIQAWSELVLLMRSCFNHRAMATRSLQSADIPSDSHHTCWAGVFLLASATSEEKWDWHCCSRRSQSLGLRAPGLLRGSVILWRTLMETAGPKKPEVYSIEYIEYSENCFVTSTTHMV